jgi:beta-lactamase superfamily II metal-dependent hydrolase
MYAHYIYVGQGDSTLLEFPCGAMLIDAGGQDGNHADHLIAYLNKFFDKRPDLNKTLESVIITHGHDDHTMALKKVCENFTVKRYVDNGITRGEGPTWLKNDAVSRKSIIFRDVNNDEIMAGGNKKGVTDGIIDPINCEGCDPKIVILWSRPSELHGAFTNPNNQSLIIRVDFGKASFLFTGDSEQPATDAMVDYYNGDANEGSEEQPGILDVDVYHAGHHGSQNATTSELLNAMTPKIAVISVGRWDDGKGSGTAWAYGLPRKGAVELLSVAIKKKRSPSVTIKVAEGERNFVDYKLKRSIYTTALDGDIKIQAKWDGSFKVTGNN